MPPKGGAESLEGYLLLGGGTALWSTIEVASKYLMDTFTPAGIATMRFGLSSILLLPLFWKVLKRDVLLGGRVRERILQLIILGLLGITGTFLLYHLSLDYIPASSAAVIVSSVPVFVAILSVILYREHFTPLKALGVAGGLAGLLLLLISRGGFIYSPTGYTFILSATLLFSLYTALSHPLMKTLGASAFTSTTLLFGTLGLLPILLHPSSGGLLRASPGLGDILILFYLGVGATGGGYILYFAGLSKVSPGAGSSLLFLKPPIASALAVLLLGEEVTLPLLLSISVISLSVYLIIFSPAKEVEGQNEKKNHTEEHPRDEGA